MTTHEWTGRDDGPGAGHARWHSVITTTTDRPGVALVGFASDEGVRRNGGRPGAAAGPTEIRRALASLAVHTDVPLLDAGTVTVSGTDLEGGHDALSAQVEELTRAGHTVIVLGGGHETAFGSHRGVRRALGHSPAIINLDAHFDLRVAPAPSSGTPFRQIADLAGEEFRYAVLGISVPNNTRALFDTARELGVRVTTDVELAEMTSAGCEALVGKLLEDAPDVHLSIDLDVLPAAVAPGVSAPAALGVDLARILTLVRAVARSGKLRLVDVVELNPLLDVDGRTARVAARIVDEIVRHRPSD